MKNYIVYVFVMLFTIQAIGQQPPTQKPKLFNNFPDSINCSETELASIFTVAAGQNISLSFSNNFTFGGTVASMEVKYSNLQSAIIKSPVFNNAVFHISKRTNPDNSITYVGQIINQNYFDGYQLTRDTFYNYHLLKIETDNLIQIDSFH